MARRPLALKAFLASLGIGTSAGVAVHAAAILAVGVFRAWLEALPLGPRLWVVLGQLAAAALLVGAVLGFGRPRRAVLEPATAGTCAALILLAFRLRLAPGETFNPLVFGWPGMVLVAGLTPLGGWLGARFKRLARITLSPSVKLALQAMSLWVTLEWTARAASALVLGTRLHNRLAGDLLAVLLAFPLIAWAVARLGQQGGVGRGDWDYRWKPDALAAGVAGGLGMVALTWATGRVDSTLFGLSQATAEPLLAGIRQAAWSAALLLTVNGIVVPVAEELAWRGVIQTALVKGGGVARGVVFGGLAFALKHVLIDASVARLTTLVMFGLGVSVVRAGWGTGGSTVAHLCANLIATSLAIKSALAP
jgi:membrane protease YdiL (CAAX protease family)